LILLFEIEKTKSAMNRGLKSLKSQEFLRNGLKFVEGDYSFCVMATSIKTS
jgi:hypothetical protein